MLAYRINILRYFFYTILALFVMLAPSLQAVSRRSASANKGNNAAATNKPAPKKARHAFNCPAIKESADLMVTANKPTAVVFYSDHCSACEDMVAPFNDFAQKHRGSVACFSANTDVAGNQELVQLLKITGVPSVIVIHKHMGAGVVDEFLNHTTGVVAPTSSAIAEEYEDQDDDQEDANQNGTHKNTDIPLSITPEDIAVVSIAEDTVLPDTTVTGSEKAPVSKQMSKQKKSA